jgi:hypothetical protein
MFGRRPRSDDDPQVPCHPVLPVRPRSARLSGPGRLPDVRVRSFELRLIAVALTACWTLTAALVLLGYRPGGPVDVAVGIAAATPIVIAFAGLVWPPATHGERAFTTMVWLGLGSLLVLIPSIVDVWSQLVQGGAQTLLPSVEAAYPWGLALLGTSLFAGFGIARWRLGETSMRRRRLVRGIVLATLLMAAAGGLFTAVAMANEFALRDQPTRSSRFGPTETGQEPPACDAPVSVGATARVELHLIGELDGRSIGGVDLAGDRSGSDFRWLAYAATSQQMGLHGAARIGTSAWVREPFGGWRRGDLTEVETGTVDEQAFDSALSMGSRATAELHGVDVLEGARARHCRIAIDGPSFRLAFPQVGWLVGGADMMRWRGELDYWIFLDGQVGRITGSVNGDAGAIRPGAVQATVRVNLAATDRGRVVHINPPTD